MFETSLDRIVFFVFYWSWFYSSLFIEFFQ